ncbi:MAG: RNA polymerase sigma factor [Planctomycetota bacterium]
MSQSGGHHSNDSPERDDRSCPPDTHKRLVEMAFVRLERELRAFLRGVLKDVTLADDALQRVAISAIQSCHEVNPETIRGWLFRIALNEARQLRRLYKRDIEVRQKFSEQVAETSASWSVQKTDWWKSSGLLRDGLEIMIQKSISRLPPEHQTVIRLRIYEGLSFVEIADRLGQPLGTVLTWMRRGLSRLREDSGLRDLWTE